MEILPSLLESPGLARCTKMLCVYQLPSGRWPCHSNAYRSREHAAAATSTDAQLISPIVPPAVNMTLPGVVEDILREGPDFAFSAAFKTMSSVRDAFIF